MLFPFHSWPRITLSGPSAIPLRESHRFAVRTLAPEESQTINKTIVWGLTKKELSDSTYGVPIMVTIDIPGFDKPRMASLYLGKK